MQTKINIAKLSPSPKKLLPNFINEGDFMLYDERIALILGDVDKIKSYVFETTKLPEIRGASEILVSIEEIKLKDIFKQFDISEECIIYSGGRFLAIVPYNLANDIIKKIERIYLEETELATITCVASGPLGNLELARGLEPYADEEVLKLQGKGPLSEWLLKSYFGEKRSDWKEKNNFAQIVSCLSALLRIKKQEKKQVPFFEALPIGRRCQSCGKRMASEIVGEETEEKMLCRVCWKKKQRGIEDRLIFREKFKEWLKESKKVEIEDFYAKFKFPKDLDTLAPPNGYIAFIYADGNNIGSLLERANSINNYKHISKELRDGTKNAVFEALYEALGGEKGLKEIKKMPFEIINIGGDDVTLIISAPYAFSFSGFFLEKFERNLENLSKELKLEGKITSSIGLVICKATYPMYFAEKLAESLVKDAKRKAKETKKSVLSYLYLTTSIASESAEEIINSIYKNEEKCLTLTLRPYTLSEFKFLLDIARKMKKEKILSKTQLKALSQALYKGKMESFNFLFYQIARMKYEKKEKALELMKAIYSKFDCDFTEIWTKDDEGIDATPLLDLIEITEVDGGV